MRIVLALVFTCAVAFAAIYDLQTLKTKDNSLAKDYYLHRLLEENQISKKEANSLRKQIFRYAGKIKKDLEKLVPPPKAYVDPKYAKCYNYTTKTITEANATCQKFRLSSLAFISNLDTNTRQNLAYNYKGSDLSTLLLAFNDTNILTFLANNQNSKDFIRTFTFLKASDLDNVNASFLNELAKQNGFAKFAQDLIIKKQAPKLRSSFVKIDPSMVSEGVAFYLGVNALLFNDEKKALAFFQKAYESFDKAADKDNALFWIWQINKKKEHLQSLAKSQSLNIYSLYAKELMREPLPPITFLEAKDTKSNFNMKDPFLWQSTAKKIQKASPKELETLAKEFNSKHTLPIYAYILERQFKFKNNYFIMPYYEFIKDYDTKRQALILAIARQESRFIPTAVSTSYALGMMQFMPFVANHIAQKELKLKDFDQDDMFDPKTAYFFANHHLNYLEERLKSPVFIAYAYNGGIGFTNKMLARDDMFKKGKFEPFLSMELVPYQESRIYAKKVLANYIAYLHLLNDNTKISSIFESLVQNTEPSRKD
ncbi:lytic transglycosylase domain-containing protein [Campylobacter sp. MIT 19-121]|uniref:lytic transglycosylase domain-containing protein n=1 Tax=Campylobacter sp. MIT 19-121 TaxID=2703906 RepID=UPI00138944E6|nr:lytic transglycosylase domain-containing protein [Campylobacter sp. MIT 19-121]NDJ26976.1 lytic transglycosylase domain-containing protein [Campylobacter sp. MIT 19-121]